MAALPIKCVIVGDGVCGKTHLVKTYVNNEYHEEDVPTVSDHYETSVTVNGRVHPLTLWDTSGNDVYDRLRPLSYPETNVFVLCFSTDNRAHFENIRDKWVPEVNYHCKDVPIVLVATKSDLRQEKAGATNISSAEVRIHRVQSFSIGPRRRTHGQNAFSGGNWVLCVLTDDEVSRAVAGIIDVSLRAVGAEDQNLMFEGLEGHRLAKSIGAAYYLECSAKQLTGVKEVFETAARTYLSPTSEQAKENRKNCKLI